MQDAVARFAAGFGCEAHLVVTYEALLLTVVAGGGFRTKAGLHVPGMSVNLSAVEALNRIIDETARGGCDLPALEQRLDALEAPKPIYARWVVAVTMGLTAASLARLFGGDWASFWTVLLAGICGMLVRQELGARRANPFLVPFGAALVSGAIGALGARLTGTATPALGLVAPGMTIVPGVPLINGVRDVMQNHMSLGLARLGFAATTLVAIALGLFGAMLVTRVAIPVDSPMRLLPVWEDALFSAVAAIGYAALFSVPIRLLWGSILCGLLSHTFRTALLHLGVDIIIGSLAGALAVGFLSQALALRLRAPPVAFAFAGVVAMLPGAFTFRAFVGAVDLAQKGAGAPMPLIAETTSLTVAALLTIAAIAIGVAAPLAVSKLR